MSQVVNFSGIHIITSIHVIYINKIIETVLEFDLSYDLSWFDLPFDKPYLKRGGYEIFIQSNYSIYLWNFSWFFFLFTIGEWVWYQNKTKQLGHTELIDKMLNFFLSEVHVNKQYFNLSQYFNFYSIFTNYEKLKKVMKEEFRSM